MASYKKLIVWNKSKHLVIKIYKLTKKFPREEIFGLTSQMRRCAVSIPSNIAEGSYRGSKKEFKKFLRISYGSDAELETQLEIAKDLDLVHNEDYKECSEILTEILKMLNRLTTNDFSNH